MLTTFASMLALAAAAVQPVASSAPQTVPEAPAVVPDNRIYVELLTDAGRMVVRLETQRAPITAGNFLRYVDSKRMNGFQFYRATRNWGDHNQIIQAGNRGDARLNYPAIAHEPTNETGLTHCKGALSMARLNPGDATTDFFILLSSIKGFDADPARTNGDTAGFAVFGELIEGSAVAEAIFQAPVSPTDGVGVMQGQMLAPKIAIRSAKRIAAPADAPLGCVVKPADVPVSAENGDEGDDDDA
ncbi:peptidylprolyl isomerase [Sphingopyxis yananensis]|uniref:peptidylprolyl isomerase n=1 Tax=Sphingopyxis yananensis TaxID=2886687 RepID=UPI001D11B681|nr:peptidylprolyl isomerase [Sphingopyxis yananensis]MCC2602815.1 peptidylprolyl isomerase [Sphingopyxis yananensis]